MRAMTVRPTLGLLLAAAAMLVATAAGERVLRSIVVHRHGDRAPIWTPPLDPSRNRWTMGLAMLTATGMQQLHQVGQTLRARYVDQFGLLSPNYTRTEVYVRSTDVDRTLMSAQSVMAGLFPPGTGPVAQDGHPGLTEHRLQAIPVHTVPRAVDSLLMGYEASGCDTYAEEFGRVKKRSPWTTKEQQYQALIAELQRTTGANGITLESIWMLADPAVCSAAHGFPQAPGINATVLAALQELDSFTIAQAFATDVLRRLGVGQLVGDIGRRMAFNASIANAPAYLSRPSVDATALDGVGLKFVEYSSHDTTVAGLLSALTEFDGDQPPYASSVVFELVEDQGALFVRTYYNKDYTTPFRTADLISIRGCAQLCPLADFVQRLSPMVPANWKADCGMVVNSSGMSTVNWFLVVAVFCLTLVLAGLGVAYMRLHKKARTVPGYTDMV